MNNYPILKVTKNTYLEREGWMKNGPVGTLCTWRQFRGNLSLVVIDGKENDSLTCTTIFTHGRVYRQDGQLLANKRGKEPLRFGTVAKWKGMELVIEPVESI